jgi:hypothetical protein
VNRWLPLVAYNAWRFTLLLIDCEKMSLSCHKGMSGEQKLRNEGGPIHFHHE